MRVKALLFTNFCDSPLLRPATEVIIFKDGDSFLVWSSEESFASASICGVGHTVEEACEDFELKLKKEFNS